MRFRMDWVGPIVATLVGASAAAGVAYGVFGSDIKRNTADIQRLERTIEVVGDIKQNQATATAERANLGKAIDRILRILEKRWDTKPTSSEI